MSTKSDILDNLIIALQGITVENGYNTDVVTEGVSRFSQSMSKDKEKYPCLSIYESPELKTIEDETDIQYTATGVIIGTIRDSDDIANKAENFIADIESLIYSPPILGDNVLSIQVTDTEKYMTSVKDKAIVQVAFELYYYDSKGNIAQNLTDPYGTNKPVIDGKTKLYDQLVLAKSAMASSYIPDFDYTYDRHQKASMRMNAASIDFEDSEQTIIGAGTAPIIQNVITYSIRVHTNYRGRNNDNELNSRLLESISNWLSAHLNLGDGFRIKEIGNFETNIEFDESNTVGGQMDVMLTTTYDYEQA